MKLFFYKTLYDKSSSPRMKIFFEKKNDMIVLELFAIDDKFLFKNITTARLYCSTGQCPGTIILVAI